MSYPEPRYHGERGEISAVYRSAEQKPELTIGAGTAVRYLATGASTHGQFGLYGGMRNLTPQGRPRISTGPCPNRSSFYRGWCGCITENAGLTRSQAIFCSCPKVVSMAFRMTPTNHHPCSFCFHQAHRGKATSKPSRQRRPARSSLTKSGRTSASVTTTILSEAKEGEVVWSVHGSGRRHTRKRGA